MPLGDRGIRVLAGPRSGEAMMTYREGRKMTATTAQTAQQTLDVPEIADPSKVAPKDARELSKLFFDQLSVLEEGTPEYQYARNTLIEMNMSLVRFAAGRFRSRGPEEMEDIVQVGMIGLIKAIDRFELTREVEFTSFAVPYIVGEIKRFFRDTTWAVHVPRRLQEARFQLARASEELRSRLGRTPTTRELSELMSLPEDEVVEAQLASNGYKSASLDAAINGNDDGEAALADFIGDEDAALGLVEDFHALAPMIAELGDRDRKIIHWRFVEELTQAEIGERLGVSQMHVSRLLSRLLAGLREGMLTTG
jgi:RNA polymerase sigma-B factor